MSVSARFQRFVEVVVDAVPVSAEESAGSDVGGAAAEDVAGVVGKALAPFGVVGLFEAEGADEEFLEGFVVFVGALVVVPFLECFLEEGVAEGFGVVDGVGVELEPAAGFGEGGAGGVGGDGGAADEEGVLEEAAAHQ